MEHVHQFTDLFRSQIGAKWNHIDRLEELLGVPPAIKCELCGHRSISADFKIHESQCIFLGGKLIRFECPCCQVIFGPFKVLEMSSEELQNEYIAHYQVFSEGDSTESELKAFHLLSPKTDGVYLNFGAGSWSRSVQILNSQGYTVHAYEPHSNIDPSLGMNARLLPQKGHYDGIFSNNVLEHFRNPIADLENIKTYLKPGGLISQATPCYEYCYEYTRFHLFFFAGRSRSFLLKSAGLSELDYFDAGTFKCSVSTPIVI